jgi:hypothetical protein
MKQAAVSNTVISICSIGHSDVWRHTSALLPIYVQADIYIVYVPEREIPHFLEITHPKITVKSQETLGDEFASSLREEVDKAGNSGRFGWYLQQFYKIKALQMASTGKVTIWDADCVPVSAIETEDEEGKIVYVNSSKERHSAYFENIDRLLRLSRVQDFSFVIPGFPVRKQWVDEFISFVEKKHDTYWFKAIMGTTDFSLRSGFSETETLGTWVANSYPGEWTSRHGSWERFGQSRFGLARSIGTEELIVIGKKHNLEIISFENWDVSKIKKTIGVFKNFGSLFSK